MTKTLILGIDGLDPIYIERYNLTTLEEAIEYEEVESYHTDNLDMPYTGQAWPSIYVGGGVNKHGIDHNGLYEKAINFTTDLGPTLFDDASFYGSVLSFSMPVTYPARKVNGTMVSGFPATKDNSREERVSGTAKDSFERCCGLSVSSDPIERHLSEEEKKLEAFLKTYDDQETVFYGTQITDKLCHMEQVDSTGSEYKNEPISKIGYRIIDNHIDKIVDVVNPEIVLGISDHGFSLDSNHHSMRSTLLTSGTSKSISDITQFRQLAADVAGWSVQNKRWRSVEKEMEVDESVEENLKDLGYV